MSGHFTVRKRAGRDGGVRIAVTGEIDADASAALSLILVNAVAQPGVSVVTVDLDRVSFLAAGCIRSLLHARIAAAENDCVLHIVNAHGIVASVLHAVGLPPTFTVRSMPEPGPRQNEERV